MKLKRRQKRMRMGWALFVKLLNGQSFVRTDYLFESRYEAETYYRKHYGSNLDVHIPYRIQGVKFDVRTVSVHADKGVSNAVH